VIELKEFLDKHGFSGGKLSIRKGVDKSGNFFQILLSKGGKEVIICVAYNEIAAKALLECINKALLS
jgi:hypothetical protein